jgi:hypothetical protein
MATMLTNALLRRRDTISRRISPTTYHLPPVTRFSNRNCKELKTDVTRCKQSSVTSSNRNRQPGKAKGEKAKCPKFCDLAGLKFIFLKMKKRFDYSRSRL